MSSFDTLAAATSVLPGQVKKVYEYTRDFVIVRLDPKSFRPVSRNGNGWELCFPKRRPLYREGDLGGDSIVVVEGEKAADVGRELGFFATTSSGGAMQANQSDWGVLSGKKSVWILPDADDAGTRYAQEVALILSRLDRPPGEVKIIKLPGLDAGGDLVDFIAQRDSQTSTEIRREILDLIDQSPLWKAEPSIAVPLEESDGPELLDVRAPGDIAKFLVEHHWSHRGYHTLLRYAEDWYLWNGVRYNVVASEDVRARIGDRLEDYRLAASAKDGYTRVRLTTRILNEVIDALKTQCNVPASTALPAWIDGGDHPKPSDIIAFGNGLYNLKTQKIIPHTPQWFSVNALAYDYDPDAACPEWTAFLQSVAKTDPGWISTLRHWFGLNLVADTHYQKALLLLGPARSGKGVICRTLERVLGVHNCCSPTLTSLGMRFGLHPMVGKMAALLPDAHLTGRADAMAIVETLKCIVGEDSLTLDRKHRDAVTERLGVRFTISMNQIANLPDASGALKARLIVLPLTESFVGREDQELEDRLHAELSGILNWSVRGLNELRSLKRFDQPTCGIEALDEFSRMSSPISAFIDDRLEIDPETSETCSDLYELWRDWCEVNGNKAGSAAVFGTKLRAVNPTIRRKRIGPRGDQMWHYNGVRIPVSQRILGHYDARAKEYEDDT